MLTPIFVFYSLEQENMKALIIKEVINVLTGLRRPETFYSIVDLDLLSQRLTKEIDPGFMIRNEADPERHPSLIEYLQGSCSCEEIILLLKNKEGYSDLLLVPSSNSSLEELFTLLMNKYDLKKKLGVMFNFLLKESEAIFVNTPFYMLDIISYALQGKRVFLVPFIPWNEGLIEFFKTMGRIHNLKLAENFFLPILISFKDSKNKLESPSLKQKVEFMVFQGLNAINAKSKEFFACLAFKLKRYIDETYLVLPSLDSILLSIPQKLNQCYKEPEPLCEEILREISSLEETINEERGTLPSKSN